MIAFLTLFLGIVVGPHAVELSAEPGVARIELSLDGASVASLGPPWAATLDFGREIAPRELVAVAYDAAGKRLGEASQWVNRARPEAEAGFALERDGSGRVSAARLFWRCPVSPDPESIAVTLDGVPLEAKDPARIRIPSRSPDTAHVLIADLTFPGGIVATAVTTFGGRTRKESARELSAVPIRILRGARLPRRIDGMRGWFESNGQALSVAAVEVGHAEVVFVQAGTIGPDFERLLVESFQAPPGARPVDLRKDSRFLFLSSNPRASVAPNAVTRLFPISRDYPSRGGGFLEVGATPFAREPRTPPRIAEAVATAGLSATRRERRRAVVLLLGAGARDAGTVDAPTVRRYLARLRVPLYVWRLALEEPPAAADWPEAVDASTIERLGEAFGALRDDLKSQRVVWLEDRFQPSTVDVTAKAAGLVVAR